MRNDFESNYLMHHGILGQKWGQQNGPPYPLDSNKHSASEKKAGWMKSLKEKSEAKKKAKKQKAALEKARKARAEKAKQEKLAKDYQEQKSKILKSGKASEVAKYKGEMTNQELSDALNRIRWEKELDRMTAAETKSNFDKVDAVMEKVGKVRNWANVAMDTYDTIATFHNFRNPDDKWDYIKKGNDKKKKKKDEDDD